MVAELFKSAELLLLCKSECACRGFSLPAGVAGYRYCAEIKLITCERHVAWYLSLLKNELRAIGWGQKRAALPISRGSTLVAMMQTADLGKGNNIACGGKLHATRPRAVLVEDDNVIQAFTADRTDQALDIWVLPG